ncbi:hypothetical protein [Azospirillum sp. sgz302134]
MDSNRDESPKARAFAIVFAYRMNLIPYARAVRELVALGMPELAGKGSCPVVETLHATSLEALRRNIRAYVPPPPVQLPDTGKMLRLAHIA